SGGAWRLPQALRFALRALAGYAVTSLPTASLHPSPWIVAPTAAIAVIALILPALSASFILHSLRLYQPTLPAVDERDLAYILWFVLWACVGLVIVVKLMRYLLVRYHRTTMVVLAGLMVGAMRSLWPWQSPEGMLQAPAANWPPLLGIGVVGVLAEQLLGWVQASSDTRARTTAP